MVWWLGKMAFGEGYYSAMDDQYQGIGLSPKDIGISVTPMKDQLEGLKARIFQGASRVELGFWGRGKGSMQGGTPTPGSYGKDEREAIRDLAKINSVQMSTHTAPAVGNLSGLGQSGFEEKARDDALSEINRTIDFAADTARGGAVVVHTGEFPRSMFEKWGEEFKEYKEEPQKAIKYLVDETTGNIVKTVRLDEKVHLPVKDEQGNYEYEEDGSIKLKEYDYQEIDDMRKKDIQKGVISSDVSAEKFFWIKTLESQKDRSRSWERYYKNHARPLETMKKNIKNSLKKYDEIMSQPGEKTFSDLQNLKIIKDELRKSVKDHFEIPSDQDPISYLRKKEVMDDIDKNIEEYKKDAIGYTEEIKKLELLEKRTKPIAEYAIEKSADTIARAGMYAMEVSKQKHLPNPLFVAPENIFPEQYGAHPEELKTLIVDARKNMAKKLSVQYGDAEAKRLASEHIKATFDVGHAYTWRKFFDRKEGESMDQADKRFNKWLAGEVKKLTDEGIIGHVHVSDNFGWADEHVTPGEGRVPIKDFVEQIKKAGIKDVIVEPAHQDYKAMLGGWKEFGSSIYGVTIPGVRRDTWTNVENSYFGRTASPTYIVGEFAPSKDWTLWSQTPFE